MRNALIETPAQSSALDILVVGDEDGYRSVVQLYAQKVGHICRVASNAGEALEKISSCGKIDLVISDIEMNEKNGIELMQETKQFRPDIDFIIMTGHASKYSFSDIIGLGADDYISKPFDLAELNAKVKRIQRERALRNRIEKAGRALSWEAEVNSTIAQVSRKLMELNSLDDMALLVLENARRLTSSRLGHIGYVDLATGNITFPEAVPEDLDSMGANGLQKTFEELAQWTFRHGEPLLVNGLEDPELFGISADGYFPLDRVLLVPAISNGKVLGQVILANSPRDYTGQDMTIVQSLASIYALATQHLQAAHTFRRTNEYLENIFENSPDAIGIVDKHGKFIRWNRMAAELYGYALDELKDKPAFELYSNRDQLDEMLARLKVEDSIRRYEIDMRRKDGSIAAFELSISLLKEQAEGVIGSVCVARDLSSQKEMIDELRRMYNEMSQLLAAIPSFLIELSSEGRITRWNGSAERTFGVAESIALGSPLEQCGIHWDWRKMMEAVSKCRQNAVSCVQIEDFRFWRPDGGQGFVDVMISAVSTEDGPCGVLLLGSDVTERKILESQLVHAQKLESIGQLAAGIAHEINTPAQYVGDNLRFLQEAFKDMDMFQQHCDLLLETTRSGKGSGDLIWKMEAAAEEADLKYLRREIPKAVEQSLEGIERVSKIVRAMKEFSHPGTDSKTDLDLNKAIESTVTVARNEWKYVADVVMDFDPCVPFVPCLPSEFNQVILNMIINAAHAIAEKLGKGSPEKGTIGVSTRLKGDAAEIRVSDTGAGIPGGIRSRIFDPFFTTKEVGKGTGQGLAISRSIIVDKHGGTIDVESEVGEGSTFIIRLPVKNLSVAGDEK